MIDIDNLQYEGQVEAYEAQYPELYIQEDDCSEYFS